MIGWLKNGVIALAIAGIYSIILVLLRTPHINQYFADPSIFKSALIVHVDLSVLVWLMSVTCFIWTIGQGKSTYHLAYIICAFLSIVLIAISPLFSSNAVMNNYIPMIEGLVFILGLSLFISVGLCLAVQTIFFVLFLKHPGTSNAERIISIVQASSALIYIAVWFCCALSYVQLDQLSQIVPLDIDYYYEMLFWSGGHLLQFIYTQIFMLVLLLFVERLCCGVLRYGNCYEFIFFLNCFLALSGLLGHVSYEVADGEFKAFFTLHMIYTGGVAPMLLLVVLAVELFSNKIERNKLVILSLAHALLIFLSGGLIGAVISGVNVTIPAHYHGSIVGITIAFMGFVYLLIFNSGDSKTLNNSSLYNIVTQKLSYGLNHSESLTPLACKQIWVISAGQLLHITGLALAGGYGVMRKSPGEEIALSAKFYMGMVGFGGLLAIIGGLMFVYICAKKLGSVNNKT